MSAAKLMKPLFYDSNYNASGKRMRAVFEREVSNGTETYRLWRSDGQPDIEYPRAENDAYILHVEIRDYLVSICMTDYALVDHCGYRPATIALYGGPEERQPFFDRLRASNPPDSEAYAEALEREVSMIKEIGNNPVRQADYIKSVLDQHVAVYLEAKDNDGKSFPDFVGALVMDEISNCLDLKVKYRDYRQEQNLKRQAEIEADNKEYCDKMNRMADQMIQDALQTIRDGSVLKNDTVIFFKSRYESSSYSVVNYLMRLYKVDVPLRTQGWINEKLVSASTKGGRCIQVQYMKSKNARCSEKFFDCMNELIRKVIAEMEVE